MWHWTSRRIVVHVKLCVLALMIQRAAEIAAEAPWSGWTEGLMERRFAVIADNIERLRDRRALVNQVHPAA